MDNLTDMRLKQAYKPEGLQRGCGQDERGQVQGQQHQQVNFTAFHFA